MSLFKKLAIFTLAFSLVSFSLSRLEGVTYVTDTGGYAYDEARAVTNLAPAIALGTVAIAGVIAIAVQNSHDCSSSSHYSSSNSSSSYSSSYSSPCYCSHSCSSSYSSSSR
jgi:hypothetical protein